MDCKRSWVKFNVLWLSESKYNFSNIGGYDEIKEELYQVLDLLKNKKI